jgi:hypothetical protein
MPSNHIISRQTSIARRCIAATRSNSLVFGDNTLIDADGLGSIIINGLTLSTTQAAGAANRWSAKLDANNFVGLELSKDARSSTGFTLTIARSDAQGKINTDGELITINNFNVDQAFTSAGYLGIQLNNTPKLALVGAGTVLNTGNPAANPYRNPSFDDSTITGLSASLTEGTGKVFTVYLSAAAKAGDTLNITLNGLSSQFSVQTLDTANGASTLTTGNTITLTEGQTEVLVLLKPTGELSADVSGSVQVGYAGAANDSNWEIAA